MTGEGKVRPPQGGLDGACVTFTETISEGGGESAGGAARLSHRITPCALIIPLSSLTVTTATEERVKYSGEER